MQENQDIYCGSPGLPFMLQGEYIMFLFQEWINHLEPHEAASIRHKNMQMFHVLEPIFKAKFAEWEKEYYEQNKPYEPKELNK